MGLVKAALKFRITVYVMSLLILLGGIGAILTMPKDVLPNVDIPVVSVIWTYTGLDTREMEQRVTTYSEFSLSNNVNGIRNIESQTLQGVTIEKVYFQPDVSIDLAISQIVASTNSIRAVMPPGIQPPIVVRYSASAVPVIQLALSSDSLSEQQLFDYGQYRVRQAITSTPGATLPAPFGGKQRQVMVDLDLHALQGLGLSPVDVVNAITAQNLTEPSGQAKIGDTQYTMELNATPTTIAALNRIPIKVVNGAPVLVEDVAFVRDGNQVQQNIVRTDGKRGALLTVLKNGNASTLSVVNTVKSLLPGIRAAAPKGLTISPLFDQSVFVSGAINDVLREGAIAAGLTGLMILMFLGSWRSTLIVLVSHPALDPDLASGACGPGQHAEHHDAGRPGTSGRHPGGRCDGRHREHIPPDGRRRRLPRGRRGRGVRHRQAGLDLDPVDLLRLRVGAVPVRCGEIPVHPAGAGCGVRHARLLRTVPHAGAGDGRRAGAGGARAAQGEDGQDAQHLRPHPCRVRARLRRFRGGYRALLHAAVAKRFGDVGRREA